MSTIHEVHAEFMSDVVAMREALDSLKLTLVEAHVVRLNAENLCALLQIQLAEARAEIERLRALVGVRQ